MRGSEKLLVVVAVLLSAFGIVMLAGVCIGILEGTSNYSLVTDVLLTTLFGILPIVSSVRLYKRIRQAVARRMVEDSEKIVLQLAQQHHGTLTVVDVAANSALTVEQAKETLDQLNLKSFNEMDVSETGTIVYKFRI